jgi:periplasmic protein TonB
MGHVKLARMTRPAILGSLILFSALCQSGLAQSNNGGGVTGPGYPNPRLIDGRLVYRIGGGVSAPRATYAPSPKDKRPADMPDGGPCVLWLIVGTEGHPLDVRVARTIGHELDEKAVDAVKKWRFEPAKKDGLPVASWINVEVFFE